jgi:hypothetical protein
MKTSNRYRINQSKNIDSIVRNINEAILKAEVKDIARSDYMETMIAKYSHSADVIKEAA